MIEDTEVEVKEDETFFDTEDQTEQTEEKAEQEETPNESSEGGDPKEEGEDEPIDYGEFSFPEDFVVDEAKLQSFVDLAQKYKIEKEDAQSMLDLQATVVKEMQDTMVETWNNQVKEWSDQAKADPEIGGKEMKQKLGVASLPLSLFNEEEKTEFKELVKTTGMGSNPTFLKLLYRVGSAMKEGRVFNSNAGPEPKKNVARNLYPSMQND